MSTGLEPATTYYYRFAVERRAIGDRPHEDAAGAPACRASASAWCRARTCRRVTSTPTRAWRSAPTSTRSCISATTSTSTPTRSTATARRLGRIPSPDKEMVALQDYRERHAQYKADPDSQAIHRQHPFIVRLGRSRVREQLLERRRAESQRPAKPRASWTRAARRGDAGVLRVDADSRGRADAGRHASIAAFRFGDLATPVHARHAHRRPRRAGGARRHVSDDRVRRPAAARRRTGRLARRAVRRRRSRNKARWNAARPAGDVRAADADRAARPGTPIRGTAIAARARARVRHDRARARSTTSRS